MSVFRNYFRIIKGHMIPIIVYSSIFIILLVFSARGEKATDYASVKVDIYVEDEADSELSRALYAYLDKTMTIVPMDKDMVEDNLFYEIITCALQIPADFDSSREVVYKAAPKSMYGMEVKQKVNLYLNQIDTYQKGGFSLQDAIRFTDRDLDKKIQVALCNPAALETADGSNFYFNFLNYMIMAQIILIVSTITAVYSKETLDKRNEVSPLPRNRRNLQLIAGHITTGLLVWATYILLFVALWPQLVGARHVHLMMLNSFVFTICIVTMAVFLSMLIDNDNARTGVMNVLALGSSFLAGAFIPQELLGKSALTLARVLPSYYYVRNNNLISEQAEWARILPNIGVLLLFSLAFVLVSLIIRKKKAHA